jgi:hypothetical protein
MPIKKELSKFIDESNILFNNMYIYDKAIYINNKTPVIIICKKHGDFKKRPDMHLRKQGCPRCSKVNNYYDFLEKANIIHNNKYEYTYFDWKNYKEKIKIYCKKHKDFFYQTINDHLNGSGCSICNKKKLTKDIFFKKINSYNYNYDYSKLIFDTSKKAIIICKKHGEFKQNIWDHYNGSSCPKCANKNLTTDDFINKSNNIHNYLYEYSMVKYKKSNLKVNIICKEHGIFTQTPNHHLRGNGCPICKNSKGEIKIANILNENNIIYEKNKKFYNCKYKSLLPFDFYIPELNVCIEYDGEQHFRSTSFFGGEKKLKLTQLRDKIKTDFCTNNNIELLRIKYNENILNKLQLFLEKRDL